MTDIALTFDPALGAFDLALAGPDLLTDDGLDTAILISLYSDRRAGLDDALPDPDESRRGWWGDGIAEVEGDRIGSRLWLLSREKQTPDLLNRAREIVAESLDWLIEDGVARSVAVAADWVDADASLPSGDRVSVGGRVVRAGLLGLTITVVRPDGSDRSRRFDVIWQAIGG